MPRLLLTAQRTSDHSRRLGYSHARRVGAAPRHLAQLAPQGSLLARQVRAGARHLRPHGARTWPTARRCTSTWPARRWRASVRRLLADAGAGRGQRLLPPQPHQRRLVPRSRPDLRAARAGRPPRAGDRGLGLQRLGRQVSALRPRRRRSPPASAPSSACRCSIPASSWRAARSTSTAAARCSRPRPACSTPTAIPQLDRAAIEGYLRDYLGVPKILWLGDGIAGDDTDGHVDDLTRFVDERTVVTVVEDDPADENYEPLQENLERLRGMTDQDGRPLRVVTLPMPRAALARGPAAAGELRQLLHRQRPRAAARPTTRRATRRPGHAAAALPRPRRGRHRLHRPGLGPRRLPLRHPAVAGLSSATSSRSPPAPRAGRRSCPCPRPRCAARPRSG